MAGKTIKQRIALDGGKELKTELEQLGKAGEQAFKLIEKAVNGASSPFGKFGQSLSVFSRDLQTVGARLTLAFAGATTVATAAAGAIATLAKNGADAADQAGKAAQAAGLQVDAYGRLSFAAEQADVSSEQFGTAMSKLNKAIIEAAAGGKDAQAKFAALGVSLKDAQGRLRPTEAIVQDLAGAFARMPDGAKKSAVAIDLFGKSGASLIPFLNQGKDGLVDLGNTAEKLGIVFTAAQADIGDALGDTLSEVSRATQGIKNQIGLLFAPTITAAAARLRDVLIANRGAILGFARSLADSALPIIQDFISALAGDDAAVKNIWVLRWRDAVVDFGRSAKTAITDIFVPAMQAFKKVLDTAADGIRVFTGINIDGTMLAITLAVGQATGSFKLLYSAIILAKDALLVLMRNPVLAAIAAIAGGIALWATRTDTATAAMERHEGVVHNVEEAYRKAGLQVANMAKEIKDKLFVETAANLSESTNALQSSLDSLKSKLLDVSKQEGVGPIIQQFENGAISAQKLIDKLNAFGRGNIDLAPDIKKLVDLAQPAADLERAIDKDNDTLALLNGTMSDAAFRAKYFAGQQQAVAAASSEASQKVADTAKQVETLGKTITVHGSGAKGPVKQTFELVDGVAKAVDQSQQNLNDLSTSADQAATKVNTLAQGIIHVPEELKGQPTPADALTGGLDEASQAVQTTFSQVPEQARGAVDGIIAEVSRIRPAVTAALSGGVADGKKGEETVSTGIGDVLSKPFTDARDKIVQALAEVPAAVTTAFATIGAAIGELGVGLSDMLAAPFEDASTRIASALERMTSAVSTQFEAMLASVRSMVSQLQASVASLEALAARAEAAASRVRAASSGGDGLATGGPVGRFAGGGSVSGPGTSTSDSIWARLSNGEFVIKAAAVRKYGAGLMAALNNMRLPKNFLKGFATGGSVDLSGVVSRLTDGMRMPSLVPAFADGGAVAAGGGRPITLNFDGATYQMIAPEDVADRLAKHQGRVGLRKAGKKPSWRS